MNAAAELLVQAALYTDGVSYDLVHLPAPAITAGAGVLSATSWHPPASLFFPSLPSRAIIFWFLRLNSKPPGMRSTPQKNGWHGLENDRERYNIVTMDGNFFLQNNDNLVPRDQVRLDRLTATPFADRRRVKVEVDVTPFRERPDLEIVIYDGTGRIVASSSVIASMQFKMEFNLHLRNLSNPAGDYTVQVQLYYEDIQSPQDTRATTIIIPPVPADQG